MALPGLDCCCESVGEADVLCCLLTFCCEVLTAVGEV